MFELLITMTERIGIIVTIAFIVTRLRFFRTMISQDKLAPVQQLQAILVFGVLGIVGTYTGITVNTESLEVNKWMMQVTGEEAIANSRVVGVVMAGMFGGWRIGLGAGLIAGLHRFTLGGFTSLACGLATILAGHLASLFHKKNEKVSFSAALLMGALAESLQMLIILLLSRPFEQAVSLVGYIGVPMIVANGIGCALFLLIIRSVLNEEERIAALQAQTSLRIARRTLAYMRQGMNPQSAEAVCRILYEEVKASAIAMTDDRVILAHIGTGDDHHAAGRPLQTEVTRRVIEQGEQLIADRDHIQCQKTECPLGAVIIGPLKQGEHTVGTLKFYFSSPKDISHVTKELMSGLTMLLSYQLEAAQLAETKELAREAEIKTLQAQIHPHFLFNTLNTILSLTRIDAEKARKLLRNLSNYIRQNLSAATSEKATLQDELQHIRSYMSIEQTRFEDKLFIRYEVEDVALHALVPPLTLQPLVENSIRHGFRDKTDNCVIDILVEGEPASGVSVTIRDNGEGITPERLQYLGRQMLDSTSGTGMAVYNVNRRLTLMYGPEASLNIKSDKSAGTEINFRIPPAVNVKIHS
ncbi:sensor histidine kinase [Paenibacillus glucanolyticus]|jgi:two-component system sensor histidine kinase LytS|uniref:sensor histidine kinase n=1 Tax=Paenibacillus TaxID=44249 RepID=UPI0003E241BE|nr:MULTISPECIES: sensor histidine kinase [Paenibacillus]ANA82768.1 histidine kinase [Paenibacillus glucanolyticus]AVV58150.1 sensor histidine kinase [Paenibacillus glucanolyticus]ETT42902.1 two-component sensor histidine kinase [Paenibacillus sp. FSL R5-808]OMF78607.1 sensor histidine kinase [Paenibacillus glucanolyticus]